MILGQPALRVTLALMGPPVLTGATGDDGDTGETGPGVQLLGIQAQLSVSGRAVIDDGENVIFDTVLNDQSPISAIIQ